MDHSQFYMTAQDYENDRLSNRISVLEKEIRALKGISEPKPPPPMTMQEILQAGCERVFGQMYAEDQCTCDEEFHEYQSCPYSSEIHGEESECNCCPHCYQQCADDI